MIFKLHVTSFPKGEKLNRRKVVQANDIKQIEEVIEGSNVKEDFFTNQYYRNIVKKATLINVNKK